MKKHLLFIGILLALLCSCKYDCSGYAPSGAEISWNDYNSVKDVNDYFKYLHTSELHKNDTVLVCGYIIGNRDTNYYRSLYEDAEREGFIWLELADIPDRPSVGGMGGIIMLYTFAYLEQLEWLKEYKTGQRVYVSGFCYAAHPADDKGCQWIPEMSAININTEIEKL